MVNIDLLYKVGAAALGAGGMALAVGILPVINRYSERFQSKFKIAADVLKVMDSSLNLGGFNKNPEGGLDFLGTVKRITYKVAADGGFSEADAKAAVDIVLKRFSALVYSKKFS